MYMHDWLLSCLSLNFDYRPCVIFPNIANPKTETFAADRAAAGYQALYDLAVIDEPRF